jgi:hypothetical protein
VTTTLTYPQATTTVPRPAHEVAAALRSGGPVMVAAATASAIDALRPSLTAGQFRRPAAPRVETAPLAAGPAVLRVVWGTEDRWPPAGRFATHPTSRYWRTDEEETGWPTATIDLSVEPYGDGARLVATSDRSPGVDLSTNRVDRHVRDRLARDAIGRFLVALGGLVA